MRWLLAILEALAALSAVRAEPPRYTVTNRTSAQPAFVVTNRITSATPLPAVPYADLYARVSRGEKIIALVNLPAADRQGPVAPAPAGWVAVRCDDIPETPPGRWKLFLDSTGRFMMEEIKTYAATASGVAVQNRPFRASRSMLATVVKTVATSPPPVQGLGLSGVIYPAGNTSTNAPYVMLSGNTNCVGFR